MINKDQIRIINSEYWKSFGAQLIEFLELSVNIKILDVGTGSGACLIPASKKILPDGEIIGIDNWRDAIKRVKANLKAENIQNARIIKMDGSQMKFSDDSFDVVISGFVGYGSIFDFEKFKLKPNVKNSMIKEIYRVLKPGGRAGFSTWQEQEDLRIIKKIVGDDTIHPGYTTENQKGFRMLLEHAGFQNENISTHTLEYHRFYDSIEEWAEQHHWLIKRFKLRPLHSYDHLFEPYFSESTGKFDFRKSVIYIITKKELRY